MPKLMLNGRNYTGGSGGGGSASYSTTEEEIGTWIDGSTIYRMVIVVQGNVTSGEVNLGINIINLISAYGMTYNYIRDVREVVYSDDVNSIGVMYGILTYSTTERRVWNYIVIEYTKSSAPISPYIRNWDFTQSLIDSIVGDTVVLHSATQTSSGIVLTGTYSYIEFLSSLIKSNRLYEIEIGDCNVTSGTHRRLFMYSETEGFIYNSSGKWATYLSGTWEYSSIIDGTYFANSTLKIEIDSSNKWKIYKDNTLILSTTKATGTLGTYASIGAASQSCPGITIKGLKVSTLSQS